jgi:integrase
MQELSKSANVGKTDDRPRLAIFQPDDDATPSLTTPIVQAVAVQESKNSTPRLTPKLTPAQSAKKKLVKSIKRKGKSDDGFPLWLHPSGRWCRKIQQRVHYFGRDRQAALEEWLRVKDDLLAGRPRPSTETNRLTVGLLCDHFLNAKRTLLSNGELSPRTWHSYFSSCAKLTAGFGKHRHVDDLTAGDFEKLRTALAKGKSPVTLRGDVLVCRMVFKFGYDLGLTEKPPRFGQSFKVPAKAVLRRARQAKGKRMFESGELRKLIATAAQPMRAMLMLGINCGFGATDCSTLPRSAVDLKAGWADFPRTKTAVERRCPLWPETIAALKEALENRPAPRQPEDAESVFLTRCGQRWVRLGNTGSVMDAIAGGIAKLLTELGIKRPGLGFYALRHTLQTVGGGARDQVALNALFGHADQSQASAYREDIDDSRLKAVSDHVRKWLFPRTKNATKI